jgi:integrase
MEQSATAGHHHEPWNKGKLVGQKSPLKFKDIWAVRIRLQIANRTRDLALFDLAIDSKLRACDLVRLRVRDVVQGDRVADRAIFMQQKTQRPVQFEITEQTREAVATWIERARLKPEDYLFPSRLRTKASLIYRRTKNLRAVQLLLGHTKLESTVRYLGIEVDDALEMAEQTEV